jgi:hypothetical protein
VRLPRGASSARPKHAVTEVSGNVHMMRWLCLWCQADVLLRRVADIDAHCCLFASARGRAAVRRIVSPFWVSSTVPFWFVRAHGPCSPGGGRIVMGHSITPSLMHSVITNATRRFKRAHTGLPLWPRSLALRVQLSGLSGSGCPAHYCSA